VRWGANFGPLILNGQWWRLLTSVFVHIGIIHIALNMWCLWNLGILAEALYGPETFGAVYVITGVAASLTSVAWRPNGISAGASGAIFGLAGALIGSCYLGEFSLPSAAVRHTLRSLLTFVGYNLFFGAAIGHVDNAAHIGGLVSGLILGVLIARVAPDRDDPIPRISVLVIILLGVLGGAVALQRSHAYLIHAQRGMALLGEKKTDEAIRELQTATRERAGYVPAHALLAHAYYKQARYGEAEAELKQVLDLDPGNQEAGYELGLVYLDSKRPQQAR
jgi:rhomboid protease GluP